MIKYIYDWEQILLTPPFSAVPEWVVQILLCELIKVEKKRFSFTRFVDQNILKVKGEAPVKLELTVTEVLDLINGIRQEPESLFEMILVKTQVLPRSKQYEDGLREDMSVMFLSGVNTRTLSPSLNRVIHSHCRERVLPNPRIRLHAFVAFLDSR
jgi:hypothetical protein